MEVAIKMLISFDGAQKLYFHFLSFLNPDSVQVVENVLHGRKMNCFYNLGKGVTADHLARCVTQRIRGNGIDPALPEYADLNTSTIYLALTIGNTNE